MTNDSGPRVVPGWGRLAPLLGCLAASAVPALAVTATFAQEGDFLRLLPTFWEGILLGPFCDAIVYKSSMRAAWLLTGLACLMPMVSPLVHPGRVTRGLMVSGFVVWYAAVFITFINREAPV